MSYGGSGDAPTFFSNNHQAPYTGFTYYDSDSGWVNLPATNLPVNNNGGHLGDQYYMVEGGFIQILVYWDGLQSVAIDSLHLHGEFFAGTQDIAVDTLGHAWIFTGAMPSTVDSLKGYDPSGQINSYAIDFDIIAYGSFFLNNTLYLGTDQDSIFPVVINGSTAQLGNPIAFPTRNFTDMASCQKTATSTSISEYFRTSIRLFPNPGDGTFTLDLGEAQQRGKVTLTDLRGRLLQTIEYQDRKVLTIHLAEPAGMYVLMIESGDQRTAFRLVKE